MNNKKSTDIHLYIREAFKVIDLYLPKHYTNLVQMKIPEAKKSNIRAVKMHRKGNLMVVKALKEVADETKEFLEKL
jgi:hypothetical protein